MAKKTPSGRKIATIVIATALVSFPAMVLAFRALS
jgi:hypothetical protein